MMNSRPEVVKPELVIVRGPSGSGKFTFARERFGDHILCEADQYFMNYDTGEYKFDRKSLRAAHEYCQRKAWIALQSGDSVVVANTFIRIWEMQPYFDMGFPVRVFEVIGRFKNIHGVPEEVMRRQRERFQFYPYTEEVIQNDER